MEQPARLQELFAVVTGDHHDGLVQIHFLENGLEPGIELLEAVLVPIGDLVCVTRCVPGLEIHGRRGAEVCGHLRLEAVVFIAMVIGIMRLEIEQEKKMRSWSGQSFPYRRNACPVVSYLNRRFGEVCQVPSKA